VQTPGGARHVAFGQQHIQGDEQVQVRAGHMPIVAVWHGVWCTD